MKIPKPPRLPGRKISTLLLGGKCDIVSTEMKKSFHIIMILILFTGCVKTENLPTLPTPAENKSLEDQLFEAVEEGKESEIKKLFLSNVDVNAEDRNYRTSLHRAVLNGHLEVAKLLIEYGADVNADHALKTPLCCAIRGKHTEIVRLLVENGANVNASCTNINGTSSLTLAIRSGIPEILRILVKAGANINKEVGHGGWPLHMAVSSGNIEFVDILLKEGGDINPLHHNKTPLNLAAKRGREDICKLLLSYGALRSENLPEEPKNK